MQIEKQVTVTFDTHEVEILKIICEWARRYSGASKRPTGDGQSVDEYGARNTSRVELLMMEIFRL